MPRKSRKAETPARDVFAEGPAELLAITVALEVVDVPTADVFTIHNGGAVAADALPGSFVKLAPELSAAERESFDAGEARAKFMEAGARAVVVAPTFAAAERGPSPERPGGRVDPRAELRAWFEGGSEDAPAALEACLKIADEAGL